MYAMETFTQLIAADTGALRYNDIVIDGHFLALPMSSTLAHDLTLIHACHCKDDRRTQGCLVTDCE